MQCPVLPQTIMGFVLRCSGRHQIALALLAAGVFGLSSVPLELQRRIINDAIKTGAVESILWLAIAYAGVALLEQGLKLALNIYRAWVSEDATRGLRRTLEDMKTEVDPDDAGTHTAMAVAEADPIGGFVGMAISEPLLQAGILISVVGYMAFIEPWTLVLSAGVLVPQMLFVPPMQHAINVRAEKRIKVLRRVGGDIVETGSPEDARIERVFELNMGIYKLKYSMNLLMNFMHYFAVAVALGVGGWFAIQHRIEVGTVVAVVSGLGKLKDPWGDLVSWGRELSVDSVKYRLFADAVSRRGLVTA
ncbi:MAG TPA: ABC transporter ATP-binding protein [Reyranella sp.]|jgi:ABC-type multidrug transport system fused ATPase/permease subunit|nr:ABC transporter ATP-binding protein [Reyranella sp.]